MSEVAVDVRRMPSKSKELMELVKSLLSEFRGRLVSLTIRAGSPVVFSYVLGDKEAPSLSPYDVLVKAGKVEEYEGEGEPSEILEGMLFSLTLMGLKPICILASGSSFWKWLGLDASVRRKVPAAFGHEVVFDSTLPETVVLVTGGQDPSLGTVGISYGLKFTW